MAAASARVAERPSLRSAGTSSPASAPGSGVKGDGKVGGDGKMGKEGGFSHTDVVRLAFGSPSMARFNRAVRRPLQGHYVNQKDSLIVAATM
eukprot:1767724-Pleurochrysis_carterae.AAC.6